MSSDFAMGGAMTTPWPHVHDLATDLKVGILFCTRLPIAHAAPIGGHDLARATWTFPIAGALVGTFGALVYWIAYRIGLPALVAAALAMLATLIATGSLHEDGLADTADGFGGGADRERRLAIMRDSRIGTYGACALAMSLMLRWAALASIAEPATVAAALVAAHASARATLPAFMGVVPPTRSDGLSADAGGPPLASMVVAALLGAVALALFGPKAVVVGGILLAAAIALMAWLSLRLIGGQTGDVVGALEQIGEVLIVMMVAAMVAPGIRP
jgi:adenosylcobinamide-GDP ribazoletransferase